MRRLGTVLGVAGALALIIFVLSHLDPDSAGSSGPASSQAPGYEPGMVTGTITVTRDSEGPTCDVVVALHNDTKFHLKDAGFDITGLGPTFVVNETIAGGDTTSIQTVDIPPGGSCTQMAQAIQQHATDNNVGTCTMEGATEGDCQKMFVFRSGIDAKDLQKSIDDVRAGNLQAGATIAPEEYGSFRPETAPTGGDAVTCPHGELPVWGQTAQVLAVHLDGDGVADAYKISGACQPSVVTDPTATSAGTISNETVSGWVSRWSIKPPTSSTN